MSSRLSIPTWFYWALLSAVFAALTSIFAKLGLADVDADFATWLRTLVITVILGGFVLFTGKAVNPFSLNAKGISFLMLSARNGSFLGLLLPRSASGAGSTSGRRG